MLNVVVSYIVFKIVVLFIPHSAAIAQGTLGMIEVSISKQQ